MTKAEFIKLAKENEHTDEEINEMLEIVESRIKEMKSEGLKEDWSLDNYPYEIFCCDFLFMRYGR